MRDQSTQVVPITEDAAAFARQSSIASLRVKIPASTNVVGDSRLNNFSQERRMCNQLTQTIQLIPSILVAIAVAAIHIALLHREASGAALQLSLTLLNLRQPPLRAGLPWRCKLEWVTLSTAERSIPFVGLGGFEYPALLYLQQLRRRYETDGCDNE